MSVARDVLLWGSENRWLRERVPRLRFARRAVLRFMPGEELEAALDAAAVFGGMEIGAVLTALGENIASEAEAGGVARHYVDVLGAVAARALDCEISVKPTQLGLGLDASLCRAHLLHLAEVAARHGAGTLWVDMEGSACTDATVQLFRAARRQRDNVGLCLQAYLRRTADDLEALLPLEPAIRLVKGAYAEPGRIAYPDKQDVDASFLALATRLLEERASGRRVRAAFATHDLRLIGNIQTVAEELGLSRDAFEFQMLYGIRREAQQRLAAEGWRVRVLISYGAEWFPWFMRRLAERPANVWFVVRNLVG